MKIAARLSRKTVRAFEFGRTGLYLAVIQWKHGEKKVRVVECRDRV
jgi:hypothetical protein